MLNPCCCLSPRIGALVFGILDMFLAVTYAWRVLVNLFDQGLRGEMIGEIIVCAALLIMAVLLLLGAWKNEAEKIRLWLILWIVFLIITVAFQIFNIYSHARVDITRGGSLVGIVLFVYQVWVIYSYLLELRGQVLTYCPTQITV